MPKLHEYVRIKDAAEYLGVCQNTLRNWEAAGKITFCSNPADNYRPFKRADSERSLHKLERSANRLSKAARRKRTV